MNIGFKTLLKWVLPLIMMISWQPLRAQTPIRIYTDDTVNVCGVDKRVVVVVSLGQVLKSDNLVAFDVELKYDPTKLQFNQILTSGTLSEQFAGEIAPVADFSRVGYAYAAAGSFKDIPAVGSQPLIAFLGFFKSTCADTAEVTLSFADFPEFKKTFSDTINAKVIGREVVSFKRYILTTSQQDTLRFNDSVTIQDVVFSIETTSGTRLTEGILKLDFDQTNFKVSEVLAQSNNISVLSLDTTDSGIEISFKKNDTISIAQHQVKVQFERLTAGNDTNIITASVREVNECSCISFIRDSAVITAIGEKKIVNSINEINRYNKGFIKNNPEEWEVEIPSDWEIEIYNILGQEVGRYKSKVGKVNIKKEGFKNGTYLFIIKDSRRNKQEVKIFNR